MIQHNFKIILSLFLTVISIFINLVFNLKTIDALIMVRHSPVLLHKTIYKPSYYTAPSLVPRRVHRHLYFNTPSPYAFSTGFNNSAMNNYEIMRSSPMVMDKTRAMTSKGKNFRRFIWNEMDESMEDLIQGVANGGDVVKHIFVNSFGYPPPVRPAYYRYKPHFEYYKAPIDPGHRLRTFARDLSNKMLGVPRKIMKIITSPPSLLPAILPSITNIHKPISTTTTAIKTEKPLEQTQNFNEILQTKSDARNIIEPISMEELIGPATLKELEREGEKRVESHLMSTTDEEIVSSKIAEFDSSWTPIVNPSSNTNQYAKNELPKTKISTEVKRPKIREKFKKTHHQSYDQEDEPIELENDSQKDQSVEVTSESFIGLTSQKSIPVSNLHIQVDDFIPMKPSASTYRHYEVTENSAEESKQVTQSIKPTKKTQRKIPTSTKSSKSKYAKTLSKSTTSPYYHHRTPITLTSTISSFIALPQPTSTSTSTTTTTTTPITPTTVPTIPVMQTTTDKPNYPEYFLDRTFSDFEKSESNCDDQTTTENPILKKLQVIVRKENLDNDKKYSHIQSVTTANPSKVKPIRKYSTKLKMSNFKDLYSKKSEIESRRHITSSTETPSSRKKELVSTESTINPRDQSREMRKTSAAMRNVSKGKTVITTRSPPQQNHIETTTIYGNRDVNYFRKNKLRRGSRKYIEKE